MGGNNNSIKIKNVLLKFREAAVKHAEATENGDSKSANKNYAIISKAVVTLKEMNNMKYLNELLDDGSIGARLWAAAYLLPISEKKAIRVLQKIAARNDIHSLTAETIISEWKNGHLLL